MSGTDNSQASRGSTSFERLYQRLDSSDTRCSDLHTHLLGMGDWRFWIHTIMQTVIPNRLLKPVTNSNSGQDELHTVEYYGPFAQATSSAPSDNADGVNRYERELQQKWAKVFDASNLQWMTNPLSAHNVHDTNKKTAAVHTSSPPSAPATTSTNIVPPPEASDASTSTSVTDSGRVCAVVGIPITASAGGGKSSPTTALAVIGKSDCGWAIQSNFLSNLACASFMTSV